MAVKGCLACVKYLVIFINFIFWLAGVGVLAVSIWLYLDTSAYVVGDDSAKFYISIYILMGVGSLMILVGFLGCCGASQESSCMLGTFSTFVLLILAAEIGGAAYAYVHKDEVKDKIVNGIEDMVINEYGVNKGITAAVDAMQKKLECCGAKGVEDWKEKKQKSESFMDKIIKEIEYDVPKSCCKSETSTVCSASKISFVNSIANEIYTEGCISKLEERIKSHLSIVIAVGVAIAVVQVFSFIFSLVLCCAVSGNSSY